MAQSQTGEVRVQDVMDPARANALLAALGRNATLQKDAPLPPFFHHLYFWDPQPPSALGRDGHPKVGGIIPDMGLPRRMWAGGRLAFRHPLLLGQKTEKVTICEQARRKEGRSGALGFVTLRHELFQNGQLCLTEWQDLVYREDPDPSAPKPIAPQAPTQAETSQEVSFGTTLLFRYSALTFNGHRIHYDRPYARETEGYAGLVVHGPLLAQLLMFKAQTELGPLAHFQFRATSALMDFETATLCRTGNQLWVRGPDGRQCMQAQAEVV